MLVFLLLGALAIAGGAGYLWLRPRVAQPAQVFYHYQCASCGQKLRFGESNQGRRIMCPRCLRCCTLPRLARQSPPEVSSQRVYHVRRA
jgi:DNA-directed RNA polymerase subunit RPC12/RpoP